MYLFVNKKLFYIEVGKPVSANKKTRKSLGVAAHHNCSCVKVVGPMTSRVPPPPPSNGTGHEEKKVASAKEKSIQWGSRSVDIFEKIDQIGEGTYG